MHFRRTNPLICICNITNSVCQSATWLFQHDINLSLLKKCCYINSKRVAKRELKTQRGQNIFEVVQLSQFKNHTNLEVIPHLKLVTFLLLDDNCDVDVIYFYFHSISNLRCKLANERPLGKIRRGLYNILGVFSYIWRWKVYLWPYNYSKQITLWKRFADKIQLWLKKVFDPIMKISAHAKISMQLQFGNDFRF